MNVISNDERKEVEDEKEEEEEEQEGGKKGKERRNFVCQFCFVDIGRSDSLKRHVESSCKNSGIERKNFLCNICERSFSRNDHFKKHVKQHVKTHHNEQCILVPNEKKSFRVPKKNRNVHEEQLLSENVLVDVIEVDVDEKDGNNVCFMQSFIYLLFC